MAKKLSRRGFIGSSIKAGVAIAGAQYAFSEASGSGTAGNPVQLNYDPKGLPTVKLGKTGVVIPRMAIGLGSRFLTIKTTDEALGMCSYALDNGLYYWDTAHDYVNNETGAISEERLGHIVKNRRNEIFLSTKISARDPEKARAELNESLKRLQTDHLDMLNIHSVESLDDVATICKKGGVLDLFSSIKEQGITRFIGFSGHGNAEALKSLAETGRFDSMLFAMNHYGNDKDDRQGLIVPAAKSRGMGMMLIKTIRPKETIAGINADDLVRFAMSLQGPTGIVVGMDSRKIVDANLNILRNFKPMTEAEINAFRLRLNPYFSHQNLYWMKSGYRDGHWG
jgi:uncharacterized protein